jgi:ubiquinone/menaquinone biosynthesis C-methylase UbiE
MKIMKLLRRIFKPWPDKRLAKVYRSLTHGGQVLDVGCLGFHQVKIAEALGLRLNHSGVDYCESTEELPANFVFKKADLSKENLPFADDSFDLVVACHILEHVARPVDFFGELVRVCKPGGLIYLETPSERSLWLPGMPWGHELFCSLSFYDDPTHISRPWSPQSLYRLTRYFGCEPLATDYQYSWWFRMGIPLILPFAILTRHWVMLMVCIWQTVGWASYLVARKPSKLFGKPNFHYYIPI